MTNSAKNGFKILKESNGKIFGYVRLSSITQNSDQQEEILKKFYPNLIHKIFYDTVSQNDFNIPYFEILKEIASSEDTIVIESFSKIFRSKKDFLFLLEYFSQKNINLVSIKENIEGSMPTGKICIQFLSSILEFEKECELELQKEGIARAKLQGKSKGRQPIKLPSNFNELLEKYLNSTRENPYKAEQFQKELNCHKSSFYRILKIEKQKYIQNKNN